MPFDRLTGTGYIPRANPTLITKQFDLVVPAGQSEDKDTAIDGNMQVTFILITCHYDSGNTSPIPSIIVRLNDRELDRLEWSANVSGITSATGQNLLYSFQQRLPLFLRNNDVINVEVTNDGGVATTTYKINVTITGNYV